MNINKMSKNAINITDKLYDELGINYHDIEISVANHLDFIQAHKGWNDIIAGKRIIFWDGASLGGNLQMETPIGTWVLPPEVWEPDFVDIDLHLKQKGELVELVSHDVCHDDFTTLDTGKFKKNHCAISKYALWTLMENSNSDGDMWVELYDNTNGRGYILLNSTFEEALGRR